MIIIFSTTSYYEGLVLNYCREICIQIAQNVLRMNTCFIINCNLLVGKLHGKMLINRIRTRTDDIIREEQCSFRSGWGMCRSAFCGEAVV